MINLIKDTVFYVMETLIHNSFWLLFGILIASIIKVYIDANKLKTILMKKAKISIPASVAFGAFTPFCACGTMAIVVSMLTTTLPWGPIMAFLTASPLMSPDQFVMLSGIVSPQFAIALTISSIVIGLGSGYITNVIENSTDFLKEQARFDVNNELIEVSNYCKEFKKEGGNKNNIITPENCKILCCSKKEIKSKVKIIQQEKLIDKIYRFKERYNIKELLSVFVEIGVKQVLIYFSLFAAIGYIINRFVPTSIILESFGKDNAFAVPLSVILGLPLYVSGASSIPIINSLMNGGASEGALLAFMITGPGTSAGAITGLCTIMKRKAVLLYVAFLLVGAILIGYAYNLLLILEIL